jgi:methionyl-tRNA synthetase
LNDVLGNLANRVFVFSEKYFEGKIEKPDPNSEIFTTKLFGTGLKKDVPIYFEDLVDIDDIINFAKLSYEKYKVRSVVQSIILLARIGNRYFDTEKPWLTIKNDKSKANETLFTCAEILRKISILFYPIIPKSMKKLRKMMNLSDDFKWTDIEKFSDGFKIDEISPLFRKIEDAEIEKQLELLKATQIEEKKKMEHKPEISFKDFEKMEMRIVKILEAENIPKSKKLLKLKVDIGGEERSVVAGISESYEPEPEELIGKKVAMLINLKPRKVMGIDSEAMILAAEDDGNFSVLVPHKNVKEGSEIS